MIVRILGEGQWRMDDAAQAELNVVDDAVEAAVRAGDQQQLAQALRQLHYKVRAVGTQVADDELADSDLILPDVESTLDEVKSLLTGSDEGLIPK